MSAQECGLAIGAQFVVSCPPGGPIGHIWGTDNYTADSSVCTAAVHVGLIAVDGGGDVVIEIRAGQASYNGSDRNGVTSDTRGPWLQSFDFVEAPAP